MKYSIMARNLAAHNMDAMVKFYTNVFGIDFKEEPVMDSKLYNGEWAGAPFGLVPADLCKVTAQQNRMQYDLEVSDLDGLVKLVENNGGRTNGHLHEDDKLKCIGVYDPDDNFYVIKQLK